MKTQVESEGERIHALIERSTLSSQRTTLRTNEQVWDNEVKWWFKDSLLAIFSFFKELEPDTTGSSVRVGKNTDLMKRTELSCRWNSEIRKLNHASRFSTRPQLAINFFLEVIEFFTGNR